MIDTDTIILHGFREKTEEIFEEIFEEYIWDNESIGRKFSFITSEHTAYVCRQMKKSNVREILKIIIKCM